MRQIKSFQGGHLGKVLEVSEITFGKYKIFEKLVSSKERLSWFGQNSKLNCRDDHGFGFLRVRVLLIE